MFDRTPTGLRLTADASKLVDAAAAMEERANDLALRAAVTGRALEGVVRIATTELVAGTFLAGALAKVQEKYAGIAARLVLSNAPADVLQRDADIAIRFHPFGSRPQPASLLARKLGDEPLMLYGADSYLSRHGRPGDPRVLSGHRVVVYEGPYPATEWCASAFSGATVALSSASMPVTAAAIAAGVGLGVIPRRAARPHPRLRALSGAVARNTAWMIVHPDLKRVPRVRAVVDLLAALFRADSAG